MHCNETNYEPIDDDLCTEETNDDVTAYYVQTHNDHDVSDDDDNHKDSEVAATSTVKNVSSAHDNVKNFMFFASEQGDTDGLHYLTQLRMHYKKLALTKKSCQTEISDFVKL